METHFPDIVSLRRKLEVASRTEKRTAGMPRTPSPVTKEEVERKKLGLVNVDNDPLETPHKVPRELMDVLNRVQFYSHSQSDTICIAFDSTLILLSQLDLSLLCNQDINSVISNHVGTHGSFALSVSVTSLHKIQAISLVLTGVGLHVFFGTDTGYVGKTLFDMRQHLYSRAKTTDSATSGAAPRLNRLKTKVMAQNQKGGSSRASMRSDAGQDIEAQSAEILDPRLGDLSSLTEEQREALTPSPEHAPKPQVPQSTLLPHKTEVMRQVRTHNY